MAGVRKIIEVKNLKKEYRVTDIFERLKGSKTKRGISEASFEVREGEVFSLIGLNGAGKTTLIKCMLGLIKIDKGEIRVFGKDKLFRKDYFDIGYLPEISYYPKDIKLSDLIEFYSELYGMKKFDRDKRIPEILEILKLSGRENEKLEKFSKGMLQRVGIAQAIMNEPKLLFLDEPMSGLDPMGRKLVFDIIKRMKERGTTIILTTHILNDVERISDRIGIIHEGKLKSTIDFAATKNERDYFLLESNMRLDGYFSYRGNYAKKVSIGDIDEQIEELKKQGAEIISVEKQKMSLEQYFIQEIV